MTAGLTVYRQLLRAIQLAFHGDLSTLTAAKNEARSKFVELRNISGPDKLQEAFAHAQSVTKILRENVVQGKNVGGETYKLNIHEHTERGDNETVKKLNSKVRSFKDL